MELKSLLGKEVLYFDGGSGTILQSMGLKPGELPETWNLNHPENVVKLNYDYYAAGSNIVNTNTFGAFITKFPLNLEKVIRAAVDNANAARDKIAAEDKTAGKTDGARTADSKEAAAAGRTEEAGKRFIAFDIGSCGKLLKPMGDLDFEDCIKLYKKSFEIAFTCNIDCVLIETMNDGYETKAAVIAAKETMEKLGLKLPVIVSNVYDKDSRTLSGSTPETMVAMLEGLGVDAVGVNCSLGPLEMEQTVKRLCAAATVPVLVKPNAGLPKVVDGKTVFDVSADQFVDAMKKLREYGPMILGGCCGTTPEYISKLRIKNEELRINKGESLPLGRTALQPAPSSGDTPQRPAVPVISSNSRVVKFEHEKPCILIGERINPTGKKKFKEALRNNDLPYIIHQGIEQENAGAMVLDVNVGLPEINEKEMMVQVVTELQAITELPLQIDTSSPQVMEAALRRYNGKPLVNSVNGKKEVMDAVFPLVKKYGGVVIGLTLDEGGIPETSEGRIEIAKKIYAEAEKYGLGKKDILIDPLAMAVSSDTKAALATMETVKAITQMGGYTSLGISNVSFGLPDREFVTAAFFTVCMQNGLSAAIMNPLQNEMIKAYRTYNLLKGYDENCAAYIEWAGKYDERMAAQAQAAAQAAFNGGDSSAGAGTAGGVAGVSPAGKGGEQRSASQGKACAADGSAAFPSSQSSSKLSQAIIHGLKTDAAAETAQLLKTMDSLEIINGQLIPGLDYVGKKFEEKKMYLPQLLMAAEAAKSAFGEIKAYMEKSGKKGKSKGKVIVATVKGDIHDIGKNIVKVLLENYDFEVVDLGKDVPPEKVVEACKKDKIQLTGLSALMTTTVASMEETIKQLRKECPWTKICVGGAVMTQEYADQIGADFYGKDAMDTVRYACKLFE